MAVGDLVVTDLGGTSPLPVQATRVTASWLISDVGTLSATLQADEGRRLMAQFPGGFWVYWDHPTAGMWGGEAGSPRWTPAGLEIAAKDFGVLLSQRLVPRTYSGATIPPGGHLRRLIRLMEEANGPLGFVTLAIDENGSPIPLQARLEDLGEDVMADLIAEGHQWRATADRTFEWRRRIGGDRTAIGTLVEGRHVVDFELVSDREHIVNDITAVAGPSAGWRGMEVHETDMASVALYRLRQGVLTFERWITRHGRRIVRPRARAELKRNAWPTEVLTLTLNDEDGCFAWFREGDTVRVLLSTPSRDLRLRVMSRSVDDGGTMLVAGTVER